MRGKLHMLLIAVVFIVAIKPHYFRWQVPREIILILFHKNLKVAISSASGNIAIRANWSQHLLAQTSFQLAPKLFEEQNWSHSSSVLQIPQKRSLARRAS